MNGCSRSSTARPALPGRSLFCAPLAEEKLWSHRVFVALRASSPGRAIAVLRFDYRGEGDSDRPFETQRLTTRIADTRAAIDDLRRQVPGLERVTLVGLRLGATSRPRPLPAATTSSAWCYGIPWSTAGTTCSRCCAPT